MSIKAISSVSLANRYNRVNFEGKKKQNNESHIDIKDIKRSMKAPVAAALFAMSVPMANISAADSYRDVEPSHVIEMTDPQQKTEKVIAVVTEEKGAYLTDTNYSGVGDSRPVYGPCYIHFISTDGNNNDAEVVRLSTVNESTGKIPDANCNKKLCKIKITHSVYVTDLVTYNYKDDAGRIKYTEYYVAGKGVTRNALKDANTGEALRKDTKTEKEADCIRISKDTYTRLAKVMIGDAKFRTIDKKISDVEKEYSEAILELFGL